MKCQRVKDEIKAYVDGELGLAARWQVARHLARCAACRTQERAIMDLTNEVQKAKSAPAPAGLREKVLGALDFKAAPRPRWSFVSRPVAAVGVLIALVVGGALVSPLFMTARHERLPEPQMLQGKTATPERAGEMPPPSEPSPTHLGESDATPSMAPPTGMPPAGSARVQTTPPRPADSHVALRKPAYRQRAVSGESFQLTIIKTADMEIQVKDFQRAYDEAVTMAKSVGGYVTDSSSATEGTEPTSGSLTLRVPVDSFERTLVRLSRLGVVKSKSIAGEDVTGEVVDLESRLRNKRAEERQYLEIMNRAKRVLDIVTVTEELSRVRGEIEEAQGRLKYLRSAAAMSTINVSLAEKKAKPKPVPRSSIERTFRNAAASLARTANGLAAMCIWLAVYAPFWALPLGAFIYLRRRVPEPR